MSMVELKGTQVRTVTIIGYDSANPVSPQPNIGLVSGTLRDSSSLSGAISVAWDDRQLLKTDGTTVAIDWSGSAVSLNNNKISNLGAPTTGTDAANKDYVDTAVSGFATTELDNLGTTAINAALLPAATLTHDIGSASLAWDQMFAQDFELINTGASVGEFKYNTSSVTTGWNASASGYVTLLNRIENGAGLYVGSVPSSTTGTAPILMHSGQVTAGANGSGVVSIGSGNTVTGASGVVRLQSGVPSGTGNSGAVYVKSGSKSASGGVSGAVEVGSGTLNSTFSTGAVTIYSGANSSSGTTGTVALYSGTASNSTGVVEMFTGAAAGGDSGFISIRTGDGSSSSGTVTIYSGQATSGNTGYLYFYTSDASSGNSGNITIRTGTASATRGSIILDGTSVDVQKASAVRFYDTDDTNYVAFKAASAITTNVTWTLPDADGTADQVLKTNGSGVLSWTTISVTGFATTELDNLGTTAINADLIGDKANFTLKSADGAGPTDNVYIKTGDASAGNSGNLYLYAGTATGTRGSVNMAGRIAFIDASLQVTLQGPLTEIYSDDIELRTFTSVSPTLKFFDDGGSEYVGIKAPADAGLTATYTLTLPGSAGSAGQYLQTDGSGVLSWQTVSFAGYIKDDGTVPFAANQSMGGFKLTNLGAPTTGSDAANKTYVDSVAEGLRPKEAVRVATTAALTLASDFENGDSVDGVTLVTGDRILIKNQAAAEENGIYTVNATGAPTRATDFDSLSPIDEINGAMVAVQEGTANAGKLFVQYGAVTVINTDPINFVFFNSNAALVGGDGITVSGSNISVDHDGEGLQFVANQLALELDGTSLSKSASGLRVAADGVNGTMIRLANEQWLRARNAANTGDINMFDVSGTDLIEAGTTIVPNASGYNLGSSTQRWGTVFANIYQEATGNRYLDVGGGVNLELGLVGDNGTNTLVIATYEDSASGSPSIDINTGAATGTRGNISLTALDITNTAAGLFSVTSTGDANITSTGGDAYLYSTTGNVWLGAGSGDAVYVSYQTPQSTPLRLTNASDNYVGLKAPATIGANFDLTLPADDGTSGQFLQTDGSGVLSWASVNLSGYATTTLNNLGTTAINADLIGNKVNFTLKSGDGTASEALLLKTGDASAGASGSITIQTGTATGTRGSVVISGNNVTSNAAGQNSMNAVGDIGINSNTAIYVGYYNSAAEVPVRWWNAADNYVGLKAPASIGVDFDLTLPNSTGTSGQFLQTNGSGVMSWQTVDIAGAGVWAKYTISHTALQTAALTNNIVTGFTLPAGAVIESVMVKTATAFTGTGGYSITLGVTGDTAKYMPAYDVEAAVSGANYAVSNQVVGGQDFGASEAIRIYAIATTNNLDQSTAGSIDIWFKYSVLPA